VLTLRPSVVYGLLLCTALTDWICITEVESVYSAVRTDYLYKTENFRLQRVNAVITRRSQTSPNFHKNGNWYKNGQYTSLFIRRDNGTRQ